LSESPQSRQYRRPNPNTHNHLALQAKRIDAEILHRSVVPFSFVHGPGSFKLANNISTPLKLKKKIFDATFWLEYIIMLFLFWVRVKVKNGLSERWQPALFLACSHLHIFDNSSSYIQAPRFVPFRILVHLVQIRQSNQIYPYIWLETLIVYEKVAWLASK
jgi:hypothetical protein